MTYKNSKTGQVVHTTGKVTGENWVQVDKKPDGKKPAGEKK